MSWTHYYGAFVVSKPHTWPNGVQIMRMAMTLFWPLDGWKCHNAFVWCMYVYRLMQTSDLFEISVNVNGITFSWKMANQCIIITRNTIWQLCPPPFYHVWRSRVLFSTVSFTRIGPGLVRRNIVFQLGTYAYLSSFVCLCETIMDWHTPCACACACARVCLIHVEWNFCQHFHSMELIRP